MKTCVRSTIVFLCFLQKKKKVVPGLDAPKILWTGTDSWLWLRLKKVDNETWVTDFFDVSDVKLFFFSP